MYYIGAEEQQAVLKVLEKGDLCRYGPEDSTVSNFERDVEETMEHPPDSYLVPDRWSLCCRYWFRR